MPISQKVVIVGAGVLGLSTAWHLVELASSPLEITVLDMAHPGEGTSGLSVGMVETQFSTADAIEVRAYGRRFFDAFSEETGLSFTRSGYLRLARTEGDMAGFRASRALQQEFGIVDAEILDRDQIASSWPDLVTGDDLVGGLIGRSDGYIDGYEFCATMTAQLRAAGVRVLSSSPLVAADRADSGGWTLVTTTHLLDADWVVNAAGPWAPEVAALLDAPVAVANQLYGVVVANLKEPPTRSLPFVMDYIPGSGVPGVYFRQEGATQLIAGLHSEDGNLKEATPSLRLKPLDEDDMMLVVELLSQRVKGADEATVGRTWSGVCAMTPDGLPVVGRHPAAENVINAVGAGASGIQLAPAIGRQAAQALLGLPSSLSADHEWNASARLP
ncbi:NAD(P)/FAD-dependent oxidoreductase [Streptomyces sp. NPDC048192]|uniref:NAD(P)/FAD-dependent oxidoreductase n=1 Tax=Streptomyces sp. NPDC048192 TaxID=3365510 RepID=UPI0037172932